MVMPRSSMLLTLGSNVLSSVYGCLYGWFLRFVEIIVHLELLNLRPHVMLQLCSALISFCRICASCGSVILRAILVSSAKIAHKVFGDSTCGRSLMYRRKSSGPRIEPWGTPEVTGSQADSVPLIITLCSLFVR